jgi:hypothetical protein
MTDSFYLAMYDHTGTKRIPERGVFHKYGHPYGQTRVPSDFSQIFNRPIA